MKKDNDYVDKLYSDKFSKFESNISSDDWTKLSTKLGKTNFLRFSFTTFNAYFLSAIISFAAVAAYFGVNNVNLSNKIEKLEDKIEVLIEQQNLNDKEPLLHDTFTIEEPKMNVQDEITDKVVVKTKPLNKVKNEIELFPEKAKIDSTIMLSDSLAIAKPDTTIVKPKKVIRIKKTVYVKQNQVIIKDTVKIKKQE